MDTITVSVMVCKDCGARYSTVGSGGTAAHTRATGHSAWRTVREIREATPSRISYQPGCGEPTS